MIPWDQTQISMWSACHFYRRNGAGRSLFSDSTSRAQDLTLCSNSSETGSFPESNFCHQKSQLSESERSYESTLTLVMFEMGRKVPVEAFLICHFPLNNASMLLLQILALTSPQMWKGNSTMTCRRLSMPWKCRFSSSDQSKGYLTAVLKQNLFRTFHAVKDKFRVSLQMCSQVQRGCVDGQEYWRGWTPTIYAVEPLPAWCGSLKMCAWAQKLLQ